MLRHNRISFMEERLRRLEEQNAYLWQEKAFGIQGRLMPLLHWGTSTPA